MCTCERDQSGKEISIDELNELEKFKSHLLSRRHFTGKVHAVKLGTSQNFFLLTSLTKARLLLLKRVR